MTKPNSLYKYQSFSEQTLTNLLGQTIYFSSPLDFNDPYDCALSAQVGGTLTVEEVDELLQAFIKANPTPEALEEVIRTNHEERCEILIGQATKTLNNAAQHFLSTSGVACFTESNDNLLMWSHYANGGRGFCLEFDTSFDPFRKIRKVSYMSEMPIIQAKPLLIGNDFDQYIDMYCIKSEHWAYEKEWRSLHTTANTSWVIQIEALKAVYFGSEMIQTHRELIGLILASKYPHAKVFEGIRRPGSFEVEFHQLKYVVTKLA